MNQNIYKSGFIGFPVSTVKTRDKIIRYGAENHIGYSDKPSVKKRGKFMTVIIYASVPELF